MAPPCSSTCDIMARGTKIILNEEVIAEIEAYFEESNNSFFFGGLKEMAETLGKE